jgi:hypothetical protein
VIEIKSFAQNYIQAFFDHPEWGRYAAPYTQDTRSFPAPGKMVTWNFTVHATDAVGFVNISWSIPEQLEDGWRFYLRDDADSVTVDIFDALLILKKVKGHLQNKP